MTTFEEDKVRVKEIVTQRVAMFDAGDKSFSSQECNDLFREYLDLRDKYGRETSKSRELKKISDKIWEEA